LLARRGSSLAALGELLAGAAPPGTPEAEPAQRFAALLDLWTQDEILTLRSERGPA
jgi:hypothetical protein